METDDQKGWDYCRAEYQSRGGAHILRQTEKWAELMDEFEVLNPQTIDDCLRESDLEKTDFETHLEAAFLLSQFWYRRDEFFEEASFLLQSAITGTVFLKAQQLQQLAFENSKNPRPFRIENRSGD